MTFREFCKTWGYIPNLLIEDWEGNELYKGPGRKCRKADFYEYLVDTIDIERSCLCVTVYKKEDAE